MAGAAIARVLLGLAVKGLKKSKPKKVVKKPKSAKATKTSAADDAKTQGRDYKLMKAAKEKDARTAKRMDKDEEMYGSKIAREMHNKRVAAARTKVIDRKKFRTRKSPNATKVEYKVTRAGKRPVTTAKKVAVAGLAAAAGNVSGPAGKTVKVKKATKPVVWRNSKRVGRTRVASKLRSVYNPKTDQWIKYTD